MSSLGKKEKSKHKNDDKKKKKKDKHDDDSDFIKPKEDDDDDDDESSSDDEKQPKKKSGSTFNTVMNVTIIALVAAAIIFLIFVIIQKLNKKDDDDEDEEGAGGRSSTRNVNIAGNDVGITATMGPQPTPDKPVLTSPHYGAVFASPHAKAFVPEAAQLSSDYYRRDKLFKRKKVNDLLMAVADQDGLVTKRGNKSVISVIETDPTYGLRLAQTDVNNDNSPDTIEEEDDGTVEYNDSLTTAEEDARAEEFCGSSDYIYIPPTKKGIRGSCIKKAVDGEDLVLWRTPNASAYQYYYRKRCGPSLSSGGKPAPMNYDEGFCKREIYNPTFFNDSMAMEDPQYGFGTDRARMYRTICGQPNRRLMGRHCYNTGEWRKDSKSPNDWRPEQFSPEGIALLESKGWSKSPDGKFFYKCRPGTTLRGTAAGGYFCVEPCPVNSSDKGMGSTYLCYLDSELATPKQAIKGEGTT